MTTTASASSPSGLRVSDLQLDLPKPKDEAWKYTKAAQFLRRDWEIAAVRPGVVGGFDALNLASAPPLPPIVVLAGESAEVELRMDAAAGRVTADRVGVRVEAGGKLRLVQRYGGSGFASADLRVALADGAELDHVRFVDQEGEGVHHGAIAVEAAAGSRYRLVSVVTGGATIRIEPTVRLAGPGASAELFGLLALRGTQHGDHHVTIDHAAPRCTSGQTFRSLLDHRSRGVFTGRVQVRTGAMGTDSAQVHRALLLSDDAIANARPQLEIDADDVKCAHGAAIGSIDPESLFYLRQRGLDPDQARALLTAAFAREIVDAIGPGPVRDEVEARIDRWLGS